MISFNFLGCLKWRKGRNMAQAGQITDEQGTPAYLPPGGMPRTSHLTKREQLGVTMGLPEEKLTSVRRLPVLLAPQVPEGTDVRRAKPKSPLSNPLWAKPAQ